MAAINFYLDRRSTKQPRPIRAKLQVGSHSTTISTNLRCLENDWNSYLGLSKSFYELNFKLEKAKAMATSQEWVDIFQFTEFMHSYFRKSKNSETLSGMIHDFIQEHSDVWAPATKNVYHCLWQHFRQWVKKDKTSALNTDTVKLFARHLKRTNQSIDSTVILYLSKFKTVLKHNKLDDRVDFKAILKEFKPSERKFEYLTPEEIESVYRLPLSGHKETIKRMFVFCCVTGLRYSEVTTIKLNDTFYNTLNGMTRLRYWSKKIMEYVEVVLGDLAIEIIDQQTNSPEYLTYKLEHGEDANLFPSISKSYCNRELHKILKQIGFQEYVKTKQKTMQRWEYITFHTSRHTYCNYLLSKGVGLPSIQRAMGHGSYTTTMKYYAHLKQDEINKEIFEKTNGR